MPNPFQRYQSGGFEPIQGLAQSGANIGQMIGSGIANFGSSIAKGLEAYNENKAKFGAAMADGEMAGSQLLQQQQAFINASGIDPELANQYLTWDGKPDDELDTDTLKSIGDNPFLRYAKMLQTARDGLEKLPTMALPKALATLNAAKGSMAVVDQQMKLDQMVAQARLENVAAGLPDAVQKTRKVTTSGEAGVDANNPFFKNVEQVRAGLVKSGVTADQVELGVQDYIRKVESSIATSGATEEQKAGFAEAIAQYREGLRTDVGEVTDYGREEDFANKAVADALAAGRAAQNAPQKTGAPKQSPEIEALMAKRDERLKYAAGFDDPKNVEQDPVLRKEQVRMRENAKAEAAGLDAQLRNLGAYNNPEGKSPEELIVENATKERKAAALKKASVEKFGSQLLTDVNSALDSAVQREKPITARELLGVIAGKEYAKSPTGPSVIVNKVAPRIGMGGAGMPGGGGFSGFEERKANPSYVPSPAFNQFKKVMDELRLDPNKPLTYDQMFQIKKQMGIMSGENLAKSEATLKQEQKITPATVTAELNAARTGAPAAKSAPFGVGKLELGEEVYDEFLTSIQKEAAAREFYKAKFGAVPVGFTDMYRKMYPEASVRSTTIKVNGQDIPIMIDSKGNATPLKMGEAPNVVEQAKAKAVTFANTEIADGVRLNGIFSGTVDGAQAFRKDYSHMANVRTAISRLVEINDTGYESLSPSMRQEADQLQSEIIAALRVPIIGPGQVAVPEQEILQRIVKNPTALFSLEASDRAALKGLMSRVDRELVNWPKSMGLEVNVAGNRSQTIRQLRLNRESKARMVGETN
jgi:hypothetical protein